MGSSTTPLPITLRHPARSTPQGTSCKNEFLAVDDDGVAGIVSAGIARHDGEVLGKDVDDFAFALIAPLGAYDDRGLTLFQCQLRERKRGAAPTTCEKGPTAFQGSHTLVAPSELRMY